MGGREEGEGRGEEGRDVGRVRSPIYPSLEGSSGPHDGTPETSSGQEDSQGLSVDQYSNWAFSPPDTLPQLPSPLAAVGTTRLLVPWFHVVLSVRLGRSLGCHERLSGVPSAILWVGTQGETRVPGLRNSFQASVSPRGFSSPGLSRISALSLSQRTL